MKMVRTEKTGSCWKNSISKMEIHKGQVFFIKMIDGDGPGCFIFYLQYMTIFY